MVVSRKIAQPINAFAKMLADETYRVGYFVRLANTLLKDEENAQDNHVPACNFAKYLRFYKITDRLSNKTYPNLLINNLTAT